MIEAEAGAFVAARAASGRPGLGAAWLVILIAISGPSLIGLQTTVVAPLGSSIAAEFGGGEYGALTAQLALSLPAIGVIAGAPLTAWLIGRIGYRPTIAGAAALLALLGVAGAFATSETAFLASRLLVGFGAGGLYTAMISYCAAVFSGTTLNRLLSYQNGLSALFGMAALLVSGEVAERFGARASYGLYLVALVYVFAALAAWMPRRRGGVPVPGSGAPVLSRRASFRPVIPAFLATIGVFVFVYMVIVQGSLLLAANGIADPATQAWIISLSTISFAATGTACSWLQERVTGRATFPLALLLLGSGIGIMGAFPGMAGGAVGSLVTGAGSGLASTFLFVLVIRRAPAAIREQVVGLVGPAHYVGQFSNPVIMHPLRQLIGVQQAFMLVGGLLILAAAWAWLYRHAPDWEVAPAAA